MTEAGAFSRPPEPVTQSVLRVGGRYDAITDRQGEHEYHDQCDSMLVVKQVNREWKAKHEVMRRLRTEAEGLLARFEVWSVEWIPREENRRADELGRTQ